LQSVALVQSEQLHLLLDALERRLVTADARSDLLHQRQQRRIVRQPGGEFIDRPSGTRSRHSMVCERCLIVAQQKSFS
jgi:hypothetical protein